MLNTAYAMGQNPNVAPGQAPNPIVGLVPIILMFIVFYFLLILPQQKKKKEHQKLISGLQRGDEVVTVGGIYGKIVNVKDATVILQIDDNVKVEVQKSCVSFVKKESK